VGLSHVDKAGKARMVDVSHKEETLREARAEGIIRLSPETLAAVRDNSAAKGDVLAVARVAGIMAAKKTPELIPLCHPLPLSSVKVDFDLSDEPPAVKVLARAKTKAPTGVEMEALTAASVALLTIYDMLKAMDKGLEMGGIRLLYKSGGKSGTYRID
jgi:cyclic pyranopterin monophosphate synthase